MATLVNYTCKSVIKLTPGKRYSRRQSAMSLLENVVLETSYQVLKVL